MPTLLSYTMMTTIVFEVSLNNVPFQRVFLWEDNASFGDILELALFATELQKASDTADIYIYIYINAIFLKWC